MTRSLRVALVVATTALALSGCGIASQRSAAELPHTLRLSGSTTTTLPSQLPTSALTVYFLKNGRLIAVPGYPAPVSDPAGSALIVLAIGPTLAQTHQGLTTAFSESPAIIQIAGGVSKGGVASVSVDTAFLNLPVIAYQEASAQIVFTLTGLPDGPTSVRFVLDGQKLESFIPPNKLVNRAVNRLDYCLFAPINYTPCENLPSAP